MSIPIPQLLSSVQGEITAILLVYPGQISSAGEAEYAEIVEVFDAKGVVYCFQHQAAEISLLPSRLRGEPGVHDPGLRTRALHRLSPVTRVAQVLGYWQIEMSAAAHHDRLRYRRWAQDPFLVLTCAPWTVLLDSLHQRKMADFFLPLELAEQAGPQFLVRPTRLYIEGGNVLRGITQVFVGRDMVHQNMRLLNLSETEVMEALRKGLGCSQILAIGASQPAPALLADGGPERISAQPIFHLDLFMTCGGEVDDHAELIFLADTELAEHTLRGKAHTQSPDHEPDAPALFNAIAHQLAGANIAVERIPIYILDRTIYSWNNALIEVTTATKTVYLPTYQSDHDPEKLNPTFACLEQLVEAQYAKHGFTIRWIGSGRLWRILAHQGGSLNCVVKVIARHDAPRM